MNPSTSSFMVRVNAFARDLGAYTLAKSMLSTVERAEVENELRREFEYLLRQDPSILKSMELEEDFGI